jgi:hypothetical protein
MFGSARQDTMSAQDSSSSDQSQQYLSKRVMINGQFVTLYSVNGVTWLSSPEDIPNTMARLDNTRITLTEESVPEGDKGKGEKGDKGEKGEKGEKVEKAAAPPPKTPGSQYRMKGPKPRPILRQGGKVVEGTPIEPISASSVNIKGAADVALPQVKLSPMEQGLRRGKIVAPIAQRRPGKPKVTPPPAKKVVAPPAPVKGKAPVAAPAKASAPAKLAKGVKAVPQNTQKGTKVVAAAKVATVKAASSKAAPAKVSKVAPKKVAKPAKVAKKVAPKKVVAKRSASKSSSKKRSR